MSIFGKLIKAGESLGGTAIGVIPGGSTALKIAGGVEHAGAGLLHHGQKVKAGQAVGLTTGGGGIGRGGSHKFQSAGKRGHVLHTDKHGNQRVMRIPHVAHIGKNLPKHKQLVRLRHNLARHRADAVTILKLTGHPAFATHRKRPGGYHRYHHTGRRVSHAS